MTKLWLAAAVGLALLPDAVSSDDGITIWWAQWEPSVGLQKLGDEFEAESGIAVRVQQIPWASYQDQVFLNFGNKQTDFDIVVGDSQWIGRGATKGLYLELTDWLPDHVDLDGIHPVARQYLCEYPPGSARYYAAPCETDAVGFVYRRDWFEDPEERAKFRARYGRDLSEPQTWDEFHDLAEFFFRPEQKRYGCSLPAGRGYDSLTMGFQPFLWAWGGSWGDPQTRQVKTFVNSKEAVAGLEFMMELLRFAPPGGTSNDYMQILDTFINGSTAMLLNYFPFYPGIVSTMGDQVGFFPVPARDGNRFISLGGQAFSVSTKISAQQQRRAKQFIAWFQQVEVQKRWITHPGCFTANLDILASDEFAAAYPFNAVFAQSLDHVRDFWNVPVYNELLAVAQRYVGEAIDGVRSPQEALDQLAAEHEMIMMQAGLSK